MRNFPSPRLVRLHAGRLLVVILIILLVSAVTLPTVLPALSHRQVTESARVLQAALIGARDMAIRSNAAPRPPVRARSSLDPPLFRQRDGGPAGGDPDAGVQPDDSSRDSPRLY